MTQTNSRVVRPFNGPVDTGLRSLFVLDAVSPASHDLQRLVYYDYLLLHAGDAQSDEASVQPAIPYRAGEILVRRNLISAGLDLMVSKELVDKRLNDNGISYQASKLCRPFLAYLQSEYAASLSVAARWLAGRFETLADAELAAFMTENLGRWGAEFKRDALLRGGRE